jgi:hypothetical protein
MSTTINSLIVSSKVSQFKAALKARDLIFSALANADSTTLQYLTNVQNTIVTLNFKRLLKKSRKEETREQG